MVCIGFLVNPVAGMGGAVGLKGTDGNVDEARRLGAEPKAADRAYRTLCRLAGEPGIRFLTCSGEMGEDVLCSAGIRDYVVVYTYSGVSSAKDTRQTVSRFREAGADLVLFCGGDGTARDIYDITGREIPVLGIPAGVKMYSAVFAIDPETAAELVKGYDKRNLRDSEIMDVDEDAYRAGVLRTRLYGIARTPFLPGKVQFSKQVFSGTGEDEARREIARFIHEIMIPGVIYVLGAGSTTEAIANEIGVHKTLLGVDAVRDGQLVAADISERDLWELIEQGEEVKIIISPIGAQGFILGRGNQQISPRIVRRVGTANIIVVSTPGKVRDTPVLYLDTGDPSLDSAFGDSILIITGYRMGQRNRVYQHDRG